MIPDEEDTQQEQPQDQPDETPSGEVESPDGQIEEADDSNEEAVMPEQKKSGFHVLHELGYLLGIYPTREDAQAFIDGHYPAGSIEHVE